MTPARITEGSAPVSTTKNATVPSESRNRGQRVRPTHAANASTGARTMATFSPHTTSRWPSPVAWKSRASPGSSWESSPSTSPNSSPASFGGKSREIVVPTNERNTCVARTNGFDAPPSRSNSLSWMETAMPLWCSASANPASSGTWSVPSSSTRSPRTDPPGKSSLAADPDGLADTGHAPVPLHRADVDHRRPAEPAHRRIRAQGARDRDPLRTERGQERPGEARILDPGPSQREAEDTDHGEHRHRRARGPPFEARRRDGFERGRLRSREPETLQVGWAGPKRGRREPRRHQRGDADREPHPGANPRRMGAPGDEAGPERSRRRGQRPRVHTVTWSRISSSVDGPIPLTSSSSSTEVNGPFSVR